jgi:hypothetical protein
MNHEHASFIKAISAYGLTEQQVRQVSLNKTDMTPFPYPVNVEIRASPIEGAGLFATQNFKAGALIAPAKLGVKRTPAGRYVNHSGSPNAKMVLVRGTDLDQVALRDIKAGEEITNNYFYTFFLHWGPPKR